MISRVLLLLFLFSSTLFAADNPDWTTNHAPFRIADNLYYVGSQDLAAYLVVTPRGDILINSNIASSPPQIRANVEKLGEKMSDIKVLLISQAHRDHVAGSAGILKLTHAQYEVMQGDVSVVETGGKTDFMFGGPTPSYPPAHVDRILHDGDTVSLGGTTLVAHLTPGHTKGCTTWTMKVTDKGKSYNVVIVGGTTLNPGTRLVHNPKYPQIAQDFDRTFAVLRGLPCDIFLGAHGGYFGMKAKYARMQASGPNPFVDPTGYKSFIDDSERKFKAELAKQGGN